MKDNEKKKPWVPSFKVRTVRTYKRGGWGVNLRRVMRSRKDNKAVASGTSRSARIRGRTPSTERQASQSESNQEPFEVKQRSERYARSEEFLLQRHGTRIPKPRFPSVLHIGIMPQPCRRSSESEEVSNSEEARSRTSIKSRKHFPDTKTRKNQSKASSHKTATNQSRFSSHKTVTYRSKARDKTKTNVRSSIRSEETGHSGRSNSEQRLEMRFSKSMIAAVRRKKANLLKLLSRDSHQEPQKTPSPDLDDGIAEFQNLQDCISKSKAFLDRFDALQATARLPCASDCSPSSGHVICSKSYCKSLGASRDGSYVCDLPHISCSPLDNARVRRQLPSGGSSDAISDYSARSIDNRTTPVNFSKNSSDIVGVAVAPTRSDHVILDLDPDRCTENYDVITCSGENAPPEIRLDSHSLSDDDSESAVEPPNWRTKAQRRYSTAKAMTFAYNTGRFAPRRDSDSWSFKREGSGGSLEDMSLAEVMGESSRSRVKYGENVRAHLGCCRLLWHDFKNWYRRRQNKQDANPFFAAQISSVEQQFGSGIVSFFIFSRWIVLINLFLIITWLPLVVIPQALHFDYSSVRPNFYLRNLLDGQKAVASSWMFFGSYQSKLFFFGGKVSYPLALLYLCAILCTYFGGLFVVLKSLARAMQEDDHMTNRSSHYVFSAVVYSAWDYSLTSKVAVSSLGKGVANTLRDLIHEEKITAEIKSRSKDERLDILIRRGIAWLITILLLGGGISLIAYLNIFVDLSELLISIGYKVSEENVLLVYGPTVIFVLINFLVPKCVYQLPKLEKYAHGKAELMVTVSRVFFLRLANLLALVSALYFRVKQGRFNGCVGTLIGQELYKLVILDTVIEVVWQLAFNFARHYWTREKTEFRMPHLVLIVVDMQSLIWLGSMVCPVLPVVGALSMVVLFFTNYVVVQQTCKPPEKRWNQPRRSTFFMGLVAATLVVLIVLVSLIISTDDMLRLGQKGHNGTASCGPFGNHTIIEELTIFKDEMTATDGVFSAMLRTVLSDFIVTPVIFVMLAVVYFQHLRIAGIKMKKRMMFAELSQAREENKQLYLSK